MVSIRLARAGARSGPSTTSSSPTRAAPRRPVHRARRLLQSHRHGRRAASAPGHGPARLLEGHRRTAHRARGLLIKEFARRLRRLSRRAARVIPWPGRATATAGSSSGGSPGSTGAGLGTGPFGDRSPRSNSRISPWSCSATGAGRARIEEGDGSAGRVVRVAGATTGTGRAGWSPADRGAASQWPHGAGRVVRADLEGLEVRNTAGVARRVRSCLRPPRTT